MPTLKSLINRHRQSTRTLNKIKMRVHLNGDALFATIRKDFALSKGENSVHGSDAPETAKEEIAFFFSGLELVG